MTNSGLHWTFQSVLSSWDMVALDAAQDLIKSRTIAKDDEVGTSQPFGVAGFPGVLHAAV